MKEVVQYKTSWGGANFPEVTNVNLERVERKCWGKVKEQEIGRVEGQSPTTRTKEGGFDRKVSTKQKPGTLA